MERARLSRFDYLIGTTELVAGRSTCARAQVGATLVKDGRIIATGYNGVPSGMEHCIDRPDGCIIGPGGGCHFSVHAEANCIAFAAKHGISTQGTLLVCTHLPCFECAKLIVNSGISRVVYFNDYRIRDGKDLLVKCEIPIQDLEEAGWLLP